MTTSDDEFESADPAESAATVDGLTYPQMPVVYAIQALGTPLVKIGRANDLRRRLHELGKLSPLPLAVLGYAPGGETLEGQLHRRYESRRQHGEWFIGDAGLLVELEGEGFCFVRRFADVEKGNDRYQRTTITVWRRVVIARDHDFDLPAPLANALYAWVVNGRAPTLEFARSLETYGLAETRGSKARPSMLGESFVACAVRLAGYWARQNRSHLTAHEPEGKRTA